jgi:hypothetical protein
MTKGILLFALNNSEINYIKLAEFTAKQATLFLKVPVSIVTDSDSALSISDLTLFDKVIIVETEKYHIKRFYDGKDSAKSQWKNSHRNDSFNLTPYDETLVIDVDYVINSDTLSYCWNQSNDFLIYRDSFDLGQRKDVSEFKYVSDYSIPFYWATVFFFRKTEKIKQLFSLISHVKEHWQYYKFLFNLNVSNFRNDFAFSIAIHIMNGYTDNNDFVKHLPGKMIYSLDKDCLIKKSDRSLYFLIETDSGNQLPLKISNNDIHVMNKYSLLRITSNE